MASTNPSIRLDELINEIINNHTHALDQLSDAVLMADRIGEVADHLIGHFVDRARRSGASWTEIGQSMGVSKQAAQKRFVAKTEARRPSHGLDKLSKLAHDAVVTAMKEAKQAGNAEIVPAHLALGLLSAGGTAVDALRAQGIDLDHARATLAAALPPRSDADPVQIPFDAHVRKAFELSLRLALRLDDDDVGTGHVLLGLLEEENGAGVLSVLAVDAAAAERFVAAADDEPNRRDVV